MGSWIALNSKLGKAGVQLPLVFLLIHVSYGIGYLIGLASLISSPKRQVVSDSR